MIGAIMGIGGALAGALNANSASDQSWQRQHRLMEIQAELNQKNAQLFNDPATSQREVLNSSKCSLFLMCFAPSFEINLEGHNIQYSLCHGELCTYRKSNHISS